MRAFLSRLLIKAGEKLQTEQQRLELKPLPAKIVPKVSTKATKLAGWPMFMQQPDPDQVAFYQKWLEANHFPPYCVKCGGIWVGYSRFNLAALAHFNEPLPQELVAHLRDGVDRGLILNCNQGHTVAGCWNSDTEIKVELPRHG